MILFLIHSTILISLFTIFYWLLLSKETFFKINRVVLMSTLALAIVLPFFKVPSNYAVLKTEKAPITMIEEAVQSTTSSITPVNFESKTSTVTKPNSIPATSLFSFQGLIIFYLVGVAIFAFVFILQLVVLLTRKYNLNSYQTGKYTIVELVKDSEPYSFMNTIFINPEKYDEETFHHIIEHEKIHIDQSHFIDKLILELFVIVYWFNPLVWKLRSLASKNLEYLTDNTLLDNGIQKKNYQISLLKVSVNNQPFNLTMSYNSSFLKNRIKMMNSKKSSIASSWKYLFMLPVFAFSMLSLNAFSIPEDLKEAITENTVSEEPIIKTFQATPKPSLTKTFKVSGDGELSCNTSGGHINVKGVSGNTATVNMIINRRNTEIMADSDEGQEILEEYEIIIEQEGDKVIASAIKKRDADDDITKNVSISFDIEMPSNSTGTLFTSGGHINIKNFDGDQKMKTSGGHINIEDIKGNLDANTSGGHIKVTDLVGSSTLKTSGGHISISDATGDIDAKTSGGNISVTDIDGKADLNTSGGNIKVTGKTGDVKGVTSGGNVSANLEGNQSSVYFKTSGGHIKASLSVANGADLDFKGNRVTVNGMEGFQGKKTKKSVKGTMNGGGASLYAHTSSGNVTITIN